MTDAVKISRTQKGDLKTDTLEAKFEFVGKYDETDEAGYTIVSFK